MQKTSFKHSTQTVLIRRVVQITLNIVPRFSTIFFFLDTWGPIIYLFTYIFFTIYLFFFVVALDFIKGKKV